MIDHTLIENAGLTKGESKVYLALLKLGESTTGPIIEKSGVANSIIYRILEHLIEKGLVSFVIKEKTKYFQSTNPKKLLDYIDEKKEKLESNKTKIESLLPLLRGMSKPSEGISVQVFEGFKGFISAWEMMYSKLKKGDEYHSWGVYPVQEERFHLFWKRDHIKRKKAGFKSKILFNKGTDPSVLRNRNSYWGCDSRYMPSDIKTPAFFVVFKDVSIISLQTFKNDKIQVEKPTSIVIIGKEIAQTFDAYFYELWNQSKLFK